MPERVSCFVIMPYSEASDRLYSELIAPVLRNLPDATVLALRADQIGPRALTLKAHVEDAVRTADFCIADLTGSNPNVMYELGYAIASQKPVILIRARASEGLPANIREAQILLYSPDDFGSFRERLSEECSRVLRSVVAHSSVPLGKTAASTELVEDRALLDRLFVSITNRLSVLTFSPAPLFHQLLERLRLANLPGLSVRLLCADPESELSRIRAEQRAMDVARLRTEMWNELRQLQIEARELKGLRLEIRTTDGYMANAIYLSDGAAILVPYIAAVRSRSSIAMLFTHQGESYSLLEREFDYSWSRSRILAADGVRL